MKPIPPARVAVIGGGLSGTFFAVQLAQYSQQPLVIKVIEPRTALGGGVAYSTPDPAHRINVPASRMALFPEAPADFDDWFRSGGGLETDPEAPVAFTSSRTPHSMPTTASRRSRNV